jgi:hypothetical protein
VIEAIRAALGQILAAPSPSPTLPPGFTGNPDTITPGWIGFIVIFLVAVATVFLLVDMTRRIRRVRYREEIREKLAQENAAPPDS